MESLFRRQHHAAPMPVGLPYKPRYTVTTPRYLVTTMALSTVRQTSPVSQPDRPWRTSADSDFPSVGGGQQDGLPMRLVTVQQDGTVPPG